jgi:ABC-type cobalamin/Fe3+-siderophores transport system ATPase subunit
MRLAKVRVTNFQSIQDSTEFDVGDITCLVGKNEAGKTALLRAIYRLKPIVEADGKFDVIDDYPRRAVTDYQDDVDGGRRMPAQVVQATYVLETDDVAAVEDVFGKKCLEDKKPTVTLQKGYSNQHTSCGLRVDTVETLKHLVGSAGLLAPEEAALLKEKTAEAMAGLLASGEQTEASQKLAPTLQEIAEHDVAYVVYSRILSGRIPKFLYFDDYYQMKGQDNVDSLKQRVASGALEDSDHPLLGLIELARLDLGQLTNPKRTEALLAKLEAAENQLTAKVLAYWSQNRHLRMKFDIRPAQPEDPPGMTTGTNIWGRVNDTKHMVSTSLGTRSRGFVWFFSFLAWYSQLRSKSEKLILLLDEPGLSLHAKAQEDLLRYFEEELRPHQQVIYTTHSPFMVDPSRFNRVRIVQDLSIESDSDDLPEEQQGTRVITEVLDATPDSLFPLQGALGYEIYQTLFIGPNSLVVEGVSDLLYIQSISALLQANGEPGLSSDWTITPVGGSDKVATFVAMIGAQKHLNVAVLIDYQKKDKQGIENLYKKKLLEKNHVLTYADFLSGNEADIEDMFNTGFYLKLVNGEFGSSVAIGDLPGGPPRVLVRLEQHLATNPLPNNASFNHYRPARYFAENIGTLKSELTESQLDRFRQAFTALNALLQRPG